MESCRMHRPNPLWSLSPTFFHGLPIDWTHDVSFLGSHRLIRVLEQTMLWYHEETENHSKIHSIVYVYIIGSLFNIYTWSKIWKKYKYGKNKITQITTISATIGALIFPTISYKSPFKSYRISTKAYPSK